MHIYTYIGIIYVYKEKKQKSFHELSSLDHQQTPQRASR